MDVYSQSIICRARGHHGLSNCTQYEHRACLDPFSFMSFTNDNHLQGMIVGWAILSPLSFYKGWAPGPVGDMTTGARGWILWTALAIMVADSVVSLLPVIHEFVSKGFEAVKKQTHEYRRRNGAGFIRLPRTPLTPSFPSSSSGAHPRTASRSRSASAGRNLRSGPSSLLSPTEEVEEAHLYDVEIESDTETSERLVPVRWVVAGLVSSILLGTLLVWAVFGHEGIRPWATVVGFLMGGVLSLLGCVCFEACFVSTH